MRIELLILYAKIIALGYGLAELRFNVFATWVGVLSEGAVRIAVIAFVHGKGGLLDILLVAGASIFYFVGILKRCWIQCADIVTVFLVLDLAVLPQQVVQLTRGCEVAKS